MGSPSGRLRSSWLGAPLPIACEPLGESLDGVGDHPVVRRLVGIDGDVRRGIDRVAQLHQAAHGSFRVRILQKGAGRSLADTTHENVEIRLEPKRDAILGDALTGLLVHEGAAAGGEYDRSLLQEAGDHATFAVAEMVFAVNG